jgi:poly-D-alanine transfer protein DltD
LLYRIKKSEGGPPFIMGQAGRAAELLDGIYDLEIMTDPLQSKKGVKVITGQQTVLEVTVPAAVQPVPKPQAVPVKAAKPVKKR